MLIMKEENIEFLNKIKTKLQSANRYGYVRGVIKSESQQLRLLLSEVGVEVKFATNLGCSSCIIKLYNLGYLTFKEYLT